MRRMGTVAGAVLLGACFAISAKAQDARWDGYYLGVGPSVTGGRNGDIAARIDPALDPTNIIYSSAPAERTFSRERSIDRESSVHLKGGRLFEGDNWVWGVESQARSDGPDQRFAIGPVESRSSGRTRLPFPQGDGTVTNEDTLAANLNLGPEASLRGRLGVPISDNVLVGVFAGVSVMEAELDLRQTAVVRGLLPLTDALGSRIVFVPTNASFSAAASSEDILVGGLVGFSLDVRLNDHWRINGEGSVARYSEIETTLPANGGSGSRFSYEPELYSLGVSLIRRF